MIRTLLLSLFLTCAVNSATTLVDIVALSSSHGGDRYANGVVSVNNGSGITKGDATDPTTWTFSGNAYGDELMSTPLIGGLNGKVAWDSFDFGSVTNDMSTMYLFNTNYQGGSSGIRHYNIYYSTAPVVALPNMPAKNTWSNTGLTPQGDYDFATAANGWTLLNTSGMLTATKAGIDVVDLVGIDARYIALEIFSNHGDTSSGGRVGIDEIAFTATVVPEPSLALLSLISCVALLSYRKRV